MKQILVVLLAITLFASCNSNTLGRKDDPKKEDNNNKDQKNDDNNAKGDNTSGWSQRDRNSFMSDCVNSMPNDQQTARQVCSCVLGKLEKKYADMNEANEKGGAAEGQRLAKDCMAGNDREDDRPVINNNDRDDDGNTGWTTQQRRQFIQGCASTAQQAQGLSAQQANSYCECMTGKIERQHTFAEAARMTAADFQTQEWQEAAIDCQPRNN